MQDFGVSSLWPCTNIITDVTVQLIGHQCIVPTDVAVGLEKYSLTTGTRSGQEVKTLILTAGVDENLCFLQTTDPMPLG